jgi:general secretion pathway protein E
MHGFAATIVPMAPLPAGDPARHEFDVDLVLKILAELGAVSEVTLRDLRVRTPDQRKRLLKDKSRRYEVSPIELIASFELTDARDARRSLDEDHVVTLVGRTLGLPTKKIDPLDLDMELITHTMSRTYARSHACLPLSRNTGTLDLAVANPWDTELFEGLERALDLEVRPVLCSKADILNAVANVYGFNRSVRAAIQDTSPSVEVGNLEQLVTLSDHASLEATDRPIINAVEYVLHYALEQRVSDIHFEPKRDHSMVRMRIDGVLHDIYKVPKGVHAPMSARIKLLARMDLAERRRPQDGRIKTSKASDEVELRVSTLPVAFGEKVVIRIFDPDILLRSLDDLGFYPEERAEFHSWIERPNGLILVTGPTGSGKTTTLYSSLMSLTTPEVNVVTIEDPIEMVHQPFNQVNIQPAIDLTFSKALRHILRQDPDIIMVGEVRDAETAHDAVQAALTGHLVLTTLHTTNAAAAVVRLRDLGVPPFLISGTLIGSLAQRLVRKVCPTCARETPLDARQLSALGVKHPEDHAGTVLATIGVGCPKCRNTGYYGRTGIFELLTATPRIGSAISSGADSNALFELARTDGMKTLREHALRKLVDGMTSIDEVLRATAEVD